MRSQGVNATLWREVRWLVEEIVAAVFADAERIEGWDRRQAGSWTDRLILMCPLRVVGFRGPIWLRCCGGWSHSEAQRPDTAWHWAVLVDRHTHPSECWPSL